MSSTSSFNTNLRNDTRNDTDNNRQRLSIILIAQLLHNNASTSPLNYQGFPLNHAGYLDNEKKARLVSILRYSNISDQYRFGSSVGNFYIKNTYRFPVVTPEIIGTVLEAESLS